MSGFKFEIGQRVQKINGYKFPGVVIGLAVKRSGRRLCLVECTAEGAEGICHIFGENDLQASQPHCLPPETFVRCNNPTCFSCCPDNQGL